MKTKSFEKLGRVTSASVEKCTGKDWSQWIAILEKSGGSSSTHKELVAFLKKKYKLGPWWEQGIATGFEIAIGRKIEGRNAKGEYSTAASRTLAFAHKAAWRFLSSQAGIAIWLKPLSELSLKVGATFEIDGGAYGEVRTMKAGSRIRIRWTDGDSDRPSTLSIAVIPRPGAKSVVVFQHDTIYDSRMRDRYRDYWKKALNELVAASKATSAKRSS